MAPEGAATPVLCAFLSLDTGTALCVFIFIVSTRSRSCRFLLFGGQLWELNLPIRPFKNVAVPPSMLLANKRETAIYTMVSFPFPSGHLPVRLEWRANPNLLSYCIPMGFMLDRFFPQKTCFLNILPPFWSAQSCATSSKIPPSSDLSQKHSFIHFGKGCLLQMYGTQKNYPQINA